MSAYLWRGLLLGFSAAAQPGPFQAYLLAQTLQQGGRHTLPAVFAPLLSDGPIVALVVLVLTQLPGWFLNGLQLAGGLFLLYLAWGAYRAFALTADPSHSPTIESTAQGLLKAALMNGLNPNPYIFWGTVAGPIFLTGWRQSPGLGLYFVSGFYVALIGGFAGFVALFAATKRVDPRMNRLLSGLSALALGLFGLYQLWRGLAALIPTIYPLVHR